MYVVDSSREHKKWTRGSLKKCALLCFNISGEGDETLFGY